MKWMLRDNSSETTSFDGWNLLFAVTKWGSMAGHRDGSNYNDDSIVLLTCKFYGEAFPHYPCSRVVILSDFDMSPSLPVTSTLPQSSGKSDDVIGVPEK
ncbi:hypothetical protein RUM44_006675 [Polyplax serrata]|uniref:Uncharacterized protein n=1 Tax=Polyplax serrata TaxID=468196 RepID=A0ABR1AIS8_POLSC